MLEIGSDQVTQFHLKMAPFAISDLYSNKVAILHRFRNYQFVQRM